MHVIIIGSGPAGVSAALYARRGGTDVTVISKGGGGLADAELVENYYGFDEPITGAELERRGIAGAKRLGVVFETDEVMAVVPTDGGFGIEGVRKKYAGDAVILAAGAPRRTISVPGLKEFAGRGVSSCAICDAFFYRGKRAAVIGAGDYALHEAEILRPHAAQVSMLTHGAEISAVFPDDVVVHTGKIARIEGDRRVQRIVFADESQMDVDGVFLAVGTPSGSELARKLGVLLDDGKVTVGVQMETNVPGIYAAGDCTGGLLQVAKAVYEGAVAGLAAVGYLRQR
jgi:ahpF family protein/thioredoxin reductase